jgi:hypothetical protein
MRCLQQQQQQHQHTSAHCPNYRHTTEWRNTWQPGIALHDTVSTTKLAMGHKLQSSYSMVQQQLS